MSVSEFGRAVGIDRTLEFGRGCGESSTPPNEILWRPVSVPGGARETARPRLSKTGEFSSRLGFAAVRAAETDAQNDGNCLVVTSPVIARTAAAEQRG